MDLADKAEDNPEHVKEASVAYSTAAMARPKEEIRDILRARAEGFKLIEKLDLEQRRNATLAERLRDVATLFAFAQRFEGQETDHYSTEVAMRWQKIR